MEAMLPQVRNGSALARQSETSLGCEVYEYNNECRAIEVIGQDWSSEVVALFLEDWELGRVALSRHMTLDVLCQETKGCMLGYLRVARFSSFTAFEVSGRFSFRKSERIECLESQLAQPTKSPSLHRGLAVTKERDVVREKKGGEM